MFFSCFNEINISKFLYLKIIKFEGHIVIKQKKNKNKGVEICQGI